MEKTGFIYLWYDTKRKMYYLGCHLGTEDDGYICSSRRMRDAHRRRPHDFKRRIIQRNIHKGKLLEEEYRWLSMIEKENLGKKYYNISNHHFGHWTLDKLSSASVKEKISTTQKGRKRSEESVRKSVASRKGYVPSEETRRKVSEALLGHTAGMSGRKHSEETKKKISKSVSISWIGKPPRSKGYRYTDEQKKKRSETMKEWWSKRK